MTNIIIGADLGIRVRQSACRELDTDALFAANQRWATESARTIIRRTAPTWPPEYHKDWQMELVTELWFASGSYQPSRGDWKSWAYKVMLNRMKQLVDSAARESRRNRRAEAENRLALTEGAPDPSTVALDSAVLTSVAAELRRMAEAEAQEAYRRDSVVLSALAQAGGDYGTWTRLESELNTDRAGVMRCRARIAEAMIAVGICEREAV